MAPVLFYFAFTQQPYWFIGALLFAVFTDVLDGFLARILNQITTMGSHLDSWGDFIIYSTMAICAWILWPDIMLREKLYFIIIVLSFASSFWVVIGAGETGVKSLFGKVMDEELSSGFHLKNPLVRITKMNIRTSEYTMSIAQGEGKRYSADAITALTKEGLSVDLDITVLYHLLEEKASDVYRDLGLDYEESIIRPQIRSIIREVTANYNVKDIYSDKRQEVASDIEGKLKERMDPRGIALEEVLLRHVELPANLADSIQQKLQAEQESERYDFVLEKEQKEAERKRIEAEGQRDAQKIINESLTDRYLEYLYINSLKDREGTIYVPTGSNGLPLFKSL